LSGSFYELLNQARSSILILSFTFSDPEAIKILNQKASEGIDILLIVDRDHCSGLKGYLHPSVKLGTRGVGEGHLHHKILVVDSEYIWLSSGNITQSSFTQFKNLAIGFFSPEVGSALHQEALDIISSNARSGLNPLSCSYGNQLLELYILPHNPPEVLRLGRKKASGFSWYAAEGADACTDSGKATSCTKRINAAVNGFIG
jgi:hypothetical protein